MKTRTLWAVLSISLAANVFVAGAFVGSRLSGGHLGQPTTAHAPQPRARNPVAAAIRQLSPEAQAAWEAQSPEVSAIVGAKMREARMLNQGVMRDLGDPAFNSASARASLERARALEFEGRVAMDRRLIAFAATLSPADRARLAEGLARQRGPREKRPAL